jgi:putative flavoprotein involved in K+ transport
MREQHDTVIIGGSQAGLAMSFHLRERGREHIVLERRRVAERWRSERWNSLAFQMPNWSLQLPGMAYEGIDPEGFAHHSEILRFVEDYAARIDAPVRSGTEVTALREADGAGFIIETPNGTISARQVVIATGPFHRPLIPEFAKSLPSSVYQTDATHYRSPAEFPAGAVLIVGSGSSGTQIADELLQDGRKVFLSVGRHRYAPRRYRGKDVIWWYDKLGRFDVPIDNFPGRKYPPPTVMTGVNGGYDLYARCLHSAGATLLGRVEGASDGTIALADDANQVLNDADKNCADFIAAADTLAETLDMGSRPEYDPQPSTAFESARSLNLREASIRTVIWATGHRYDFDWVKLRVFDGNGGPVQQRGVTGCPGAYFLGLHWMHNFRSGLLSYVGADAAYLADHIDAAVST